MVLTLSWAMQLTSERSDLQLRIWPLEGRPSVQEVGLARPGSMELLSWFVSFVFFLEFLAIGSSTDHKAKLALKQMILLLLGLITALLPMQCFQWNVLLQTTDNMSWLSAAIQRHLLELLTRGGSHGCKCWTDLTQPPLPPPMVVVLYIE